jgi:hypothetical protein
VLAAIAEGAVMRIVEVFWSEATVKRHAEIVEKWGQPIIPAIASAPKDR